MVAGHDRSRDAVIEVGGLVNRFGKQTVHDKLDLTVYRGEIMGVVGGSGTGKSVLLRSIVGLQRPTAGAVKVFGEDLQQLSDGRRSAVERRFGVLFQRGALFSSLTVLENVALPLIENGGLNRAEAERLSQVKLALAGLPADAGDKYPAALSGGMIKRAALARALALDPDILFLDEPTAGLDPIGAAAFDKLIVTLRDALGLTVFLVTHDLDTLYAICDRVAVLSEKRVLIAADIDTVAADPDPWIQEYFHGPRGRAAASTRNGPEKSGASARHDADNALADAANETTDVSEIDAGNNTGNKTKTDIEHDAANTTAHHAENNAASQPPEQN